MSGDLMLDRRRVLSRLLAGAAALAAAPRAFAQGFAGMGAEASEFAQVVPGAALDFPRDHLAHPGFRIEWWYVTANLQGPAGRPYGELKIVDFLTCSDELYWCTCCRDATEGSSAPSSTIQLGYYNAANPCSLFER